MDLNQAINLRNQTIVKQQELLNLPSPNINYSQQELRTGMQGRVQRQEHKRFINEKNRLLRLYSKQKSDLDKYINDLQQEQSPDSPISQIPIVNFFKSPILRKIRNTRQRSVRQWY